MTSITELPPSRRIEPDNINSVPDSAVPEALRKEIEEANAAFEEKKKKWEEERCKRRYKVKYGSVVAYPVVVKDTDSMEKLVSTAREAVVKKITKLEAEQKEEEKAGEGGKKRKSLPSLPLPELHNCRLREYDSVRGMALEPYEAGPAAVKDVIDLVRRIIHTLRWRQ